MSHYFDEAPAVRSATTTITVDVPGARFELVTDRGVFSHGRLDPGTAVLLRAAPAPPTSGHLLDLGCGAGPIAITLARRSPAATVWAVDVNERARQLCAANADRLALANIRVVAPDEVPPDVALGGLWSNPPIRVGKAVLHDLLTTWLARLADDGTAHLVVHKHLGSDSLQRWLGERGWAVSRVVSVRGYRVLSVSQR